MGYIDIYRERVNVKNVFFATLTKFFTLFRLNPFYNNHSNFFLFVITNIKKKQNKKEQGKH